MTAPDVAALAAALHHIHTTVPPYIVREPPDGQHERDATAIIAALAAQGARIYRVGPPTDEQAIADAFDVPIDLVTGPVSAQAAPDCCGGCVCEVPHGDALRATLKGLADEVYPAERVATGTYIHMHPYATTCCSACHVADRALIDARLAALDA